jgi:psiF repeat
MEMRARTWTVGAALLVSLSLGSLASGGDKPLTGQQQKMASCNQQAKEKSLKGDERKTFMSDCLKAEKAVHNAQQEKMKDCNKQATGKKGAERKSFMKECLSGSKT